MAKEPLIGSGGLALIRSAYPNLTPTEKRVADYCLQHPEETMYLSVTQLGERCGVGESTIIRFSQAVGFTGYQALKLSLAIELTGKQQREPMGTLPSDASMETLIERVTAMNVSALQDTSRMVHPRTLEKAADAIIKAKRLFFVGVGASGITAKDAQSRFLRIGMLAFCLSDAHHQLMVMAHLTKQDVCVAFSHSGSTKDAVDCVRLAKQNGAFTIAVTDAFKSPITEHADIVLLTSSAEDPLQGGSLRSKLAQVHMVDLLFAGVAHRLGREVVDLQKKTALSVVDRLY